MRGGDVCHVIIDGIDFTYAHSFSVQSIASNGHISVPAIVQLSHQKVLYL